MYQDFEFEDWLTLLNKKNKNEDDYLKIAFIYETGLTVKPNKAIKKDYKKAFLFYLQGAELDYIECKLRLADLLCEGIGCKQDIDKAILIYTELVEKRNEIAAHNLSTVYRDKEDFHKAFNFLVIEYEISKLPPIELGFHYLFGLGTAKNQKKAIEIFTEINSNKNKYCEIDLETANYQLAIFYLNTQNIYHAKKLLKENNNEQSDEILRIIGR